MRVQGAGSGRTPLQLLNIRAPKNGYCYVYLSNEAGEHVYFDNFKVTHNRGRIVEENHYYAYGLRIQAISSKKLGEASEGHLQNQHLYNDKELIEEADLGWYDYGFRDYDPQIGRFLQMDPLTDEFPWQSPYVYADSDPITNIDEDGLSALTKVLATVAPVVDNGSTGINVTVVAKVAKKASTWSKVGGFLSKAADVATDFIPVVSGVKDIYRGVRDGDWQQVAMGVGSIALDAMTMGGASMGKGLAKQAVKHGDELVRLAKGGVDNVLGKADDAAKRFAKRSPCGCFLAGTLVLTSAGQKPIEAVKVGDVVWAYNDTIGSYAEKRVINVFQYERDSVYHITVGTEVIKATSDHPFFIGGRWLKVRELKAGDNVVTYSGAKLPIQSIRVVPGRQTVYNFEVEDFHTYYVSEAQVLVHNSGPCPTKFGGKTGSTAANKAGQDLHKLYKAHLHNPAKGLYKEFTGLLKKYGIKPDFVDFNTKTIYDLKPNNRRKMSEYKKQLANYKKIFETEFGGIWNTVIDTY